MTRIQAFNNLSFRSFKQKTGGRCFVRVLISVLFSQKAQEVKNHFLSRRFPEAKCSVAMCVCVGVCVSIILPAAVEDQLDCSNWSSSFWCELPECLAMSPTGFLTSHSLDILLLQYKLEKLSLPFVFSGLTNKEIITALGLHVISKKDILQGIN